MNHTVIALMVGAAVFVGGGYYAYTNFFVDDVNISMTEENDTAEFRSGTFASLIEHGQDLMCTFKYNDSSNISSGTVYLADGAKRIRGDFNIQQSSAGPMQVSLVRIDGYNHIWGSFYSQGIKARVTAEEEGQLFATEDGGIDEDTTFECLPWSVDASKFTLPAEVNFIEANMQVQPANDQLDSIKAQQCATCMQIPAGMPREQCLLAMSCNN